MQINIAIDESHRNKIVEKLAHLLADTYLLYLKTQNYHWNVTGPNFHSLHEMFEEQYEELAKAIDEIAERIRALGQNAPASFAQFSKLAIVKEETGNPNSTQMIKQLISDHETVIRVARDAYPVADDAKDEATADLVTERLAAHEKAAWMLRSLLA